MWSLLASPQEQIIIIETTEDDDNNKNNASNNMRNDCDNKLGAPIPPLTSDVIILAQPIQRSS